MWEFDDHGAEGTAPQMIDQAVYELITRPLDTPEGSLTVAARESTETASQ